MIIHLEWEAAGSSLISKRKSLSRFSALAMVLSPVEFSFAQPRLGNELGNDLVLTGSATVSY